MAKAYLFVKAGYEGCSIGDTVYLSESVAEAALAKEQENTNSEYYNHPMDDCPWYVDEFELDERRN